MQAGRQLAPGEIPQPVMEYILHILRHTLYGQIVLVAQDNRLIQIERREKLRVQACQLTQCEAGRARQDFSALAQRIRMAFAGLDYGQLALVVKAGEVVQIERTLKERFTGLDGEGI